MFRLELDLNLYFVPLMSESGRGIGLTRTIELPFAPHSKLLIAGRQLDDCPEPVGFTLTEVTWDMDRQVFLAQTSLIESSLPIASIPDSLGYWVSKGWRLGSYLDSYQEPDEPPVSDDGEEISAPEQYDDETMETWLTKSPRSRPAQFNKLLRALVRTMAELYNNWEVAYAIDKTKQFYPDDERQKSDAPAAKRFFDAKFEFENMSFDHKYEWRERVQKTYPRLARLIPGSSR